jgi:hypothetical protein
MAALVIGVDDQTGLQPSDLPGAVGVILPAQAYDDPVFRTVALPAGVWTSLATRDFNRAAFMVFKASGGGDVLIRPGGEALAFPLTFGDLETVFTLRYVDFLTLVTADIYGRSAAGVSVTVGVVRQL